MNQQKGRYIARGTHGYTFRRHADWTSFNDPLNFKVDRSKSSTATTGTVSPSDVAELQAELVRLQK
jgi:hypothetical protein